MLALRHQPFCTPPSPRANHASRRCLRSLPSPTLSDTCAWLTPDRVTVFCFSGGVRPACICTRPQRPTNPSFTFVLLAELEGPIGDARADSPAAPVIPSPLSYPPQCRELQTELVAGKKPQCDKSHGVPSLSLSDKIVEPRKSKNPKIIKKTRKIKKNIFLAQTNHLFSRWGLLDGMPEREVRPRLAPAGVGSQPLSPFPPIEPRQAELLYPILTGGDYDLRPSPETDATLLLHDRKIGRAHV